MIIWFKSDFLRTRDRKAEYKVNQKTGLGSKCLVCAHCFLSFIFIAFVAFYLVYTWGTQASEKSKRKNPAAYANDK